ncbi:ABC transporter substrate-binding protein [Sphingobacterium hungaricum]
MILVQNRQQRLSGNKIQIVKFSFFAFIFLFVIASCAPKKGVLRSPDPRAGTAGQVKDGDSPSKTVTEVTPEEVKVVGKKNYENQIALVLPFQLDKVGTDSLGADDIKRSSLALDFYQGFQLGLDELAKSGTNFTLNILDSRDNVSQNQTLARSEDVQNASIIIGPVYPTEIKTFGSNLTDKNILQVNPLAASMPSEFNLPNLVSLTPSIRSHTRAIAGQVAKAYEPGDVVIIYNTSDADNRQFINGMQSEIKRLDVDANIITVSTIEQLNEKLVIAGTNIIVTGTTNKFQINALLNNLDSKSSEGLNTFKLFGHPLWSKFDFSANQNFANYSPVISSESILRKSSSPVRALDELYRSTYGVSPSDHSYKGYDAARYFGKLIAKYGDDYAAHVVDENYSGIFSSYKFSKNNVYGYVNESVSFLQFRNGSFQLR